MRSPRVERGATGGRCSHASAGSDDGRRPARIRRSVVRRRRGGREGAGRPGSGARRASAGRGARPDDSGDRDGTRLPLPPRAWRRRSGALVSRGARDIRDDRPRLSSRRQRRMHRSSAHHVGRRRGASGRGRGERAGNAWQESRLKAPCWPPENVRRIGGGNGARPPRVRGGRGRVGRRLIGFDQCCGFSTEISWKPNEAPSRKASTR